MKKYALRANCFGYNDENYYICGMSLRDTFDSLEDAQAAYREAQLGYLRDMRLGEHDKIFNGESDFARWVDTFVFEKTGKHIGSEQDGWFGFDMDPPAYHELSDDELYELGEQGGFNGFKLVEFDDETGMVALWNPRDEKLVRWTDDYYSGVLYGESTEEVIEFARRHEVMIDWGYFTATGSPEALSDSPALFRSVIDADEYVDYDESDGQLGIESASIETVLSLNELLKTPIFELRPVSLEELREAEADQGDLAAGVGGSVASGYLVKLLKAAGWIVVPAALYTAFQCRGSGCENFLSEIGSSSLSILKWMGYGFLALLGLLVLFVLVANITEREAKKDPPDSDS